MAKREKWMGLATASHGEAVCFVQSKNTVLECEPLDLQSIPL